MRGDSVHLLILDCSATIGKSYIKLCIQWFSGRLKPHLNAISHGDEHLQR